MDADCGGSYSSADFMGAVDGGGIKAVMFSPKPPIELIPSQFIFGLAGILLHGKVKYAANNWMRGMSWSTVYGGVQRHLNAWYLGEDTDPDSKLSHLFHAACGIMFLTFYASRTDYKKFDDRTYKES